MRWAHVISWAPKASGVMAVGLGAAGLLHCSVDYQVDPNFGDGGAPGDGDGDGDNGGNPGDGDGDGDGDNGGTGGTTGVVSCGDESVCVAPAPSGWLGPIALGTTDPDGSINCLGTGYDSPVLSKLGGLDEGGAACDCSCSNPTGMECGAVSLRRYANQTACNETGMTDWTASLGVGSCTAVMGGSASYRAVVPFSADSCTAIPVTDIDEPVAATRGFGCQTADLGEGMCDGSDLCLPSLEAPLAHHCIHRTGDHACPVGPYSDKSVYFDDFEDERTCEGCACSEPTGQCSGQVYLESDCDGTIETLEYGSVTYNGGCTSLLGSGAPSFVDATMGPTMPSGSCEPTASALSGAVVLSGAVTVCCAP